MIVQLNKEPFPRLAFRDDTFAIHQAESARCGDRYPLPFAPGKLREKGTCPFRPSGESVTIYLG